MPNFASRNHSGHRYCFRDSQVGLNLPGCIGSAVVLTIFMIGLSSAVKAWPAVTAAIAMAMTGRVINVRWFIFRKAAFFCFSRDFSGTLRFLALCLYQQLPQMRRGPFPVQLTRRDSQCQFLPGVRVERLVWQQSVLAPEH